MWKGSLYQQNAVIRILQELLRPEPKNLAREWKWRARIALYILVVPCRCNGGLRQSGISGRSRTARYPPKHCTIRANSYTKPRKVACTTDTLVCSSSSRIVCVREIGPQLSLHSCIDISACCCHCSNTPTAKSHHLSRLIEGYRTSNLGCPHRAYPAASEEQGSENYSTLVTTH